MSDVLDLARPELLKLTRYKPGAYDRDFIRLNANESPWRLPSDSSARGLNVYPPPRPDELKRLLATHYGVDPAGLLVTRGSSEAIDVLIRAFCRSGEDSVLICPPTFDMYRVYATIQGADIVRVPLIADADFALDADAVLGAVDASVKIVFVCSPNNPTGGAVPRATLERLSEGLAGRALIVLDEAYYEFSSEPDCADLVARYDHVVILRTLSKFVALAGARCGCLIGAQRLIDFLDGVLPPYTFPTPSIELVAQAFEERSLTVARERIALIRNERRSLTEALSNAPDVLHVYPSQANFILVRVRDRDAFVDATHAAGILVRVFDGDAALADCVRITIGRPEDNDRLLQAVAAGR